MAGTPAIGEESTAISRTVIEPFLPHQAPPRVTGKLTDPEFSRFTGYVPCCLYLVAVHARLSVDGKCGKRTEAASTFITPLPPETAMLWVQNGEIMGSVTNSKNRLGGLTLARPTSRLRMGYFPLPEAEARRMRQHLVFPVPSFTALDPCAGEGKALAVVTEGTTRGQRRGIELDAYRAEEAKQRLDQVIYGDCFDVECKVESCSCALLNPSYDNAPEGDGAGQRLEALFLQHSYRWLKPGGVLILVIPIGQTGPVRQPVVGPV